MEHPLCMDDFVSRKLSEMDGYSQMSFSVEFYSVEFSCLLENKQTALNYCFLNEGNASKVV